MVLDSAWTDPERLRKKYRNPFAGVAGDSTSDNIPQEAPVSNPPSGPVVVPPSPHCPHSMEYVWCAGSTGRLPTAKRVIDLSLFDRLYNPLTRNYNRISRLERGAQECVKVLSYDGFEAIISLSHPLIRSHKDFEGLAISEFKENDMCLGGAMFMPVTLRIKKIIPVGVLEIVHISLETEHIFASGTMPDKMFLGHNKDDDAPERPPTV